MKSFEVYPKLDIEISRGKGVYIYDKQGKEYLDLYGGHAVISIGHSHAVYVNSITNQIKKLGFYSNAIQIPLQNELADKLGKLSGYDDYHLFLCNSGAEANENALKLASFHTCKKKVIAFKKAFHGRTSAAVAITDNTKIIAPINKGHEVVTLTLNDYESLKKEIDKGDVCAVIIEGIQGVGGVNTPNEKFLQQVEAVCKEKEVVLILDEIQSGYGRTGKFFAHQYAGIKPDLITVAKGMGNGFPMGGVLIGPDFNASYGLLGSTFGGNHLACTAGIAVLKVLKAENMIENARKIGDLLEEELIKLPKIKRVKGMGLMLGVEFDFPVKKIRMQLLNKYNILTGTSVDPHLIRILPPLCISEEQIRPFINALNELLKLPCSESPVRTLSEDKS